MRTRCADRPLPAQDRQIRMPA